MRKFNNPLDNIHVASPCSANWDEMFGDQRKRHCGDCKLNVYNLSNMTRREAENLIINSEGRLCVRFFRRADGTVITKNCPVGWQAVKRRVSRVATAAFSLIAGLFGGIAAFNLTTREPDIVGVMEIQTTGAIFQKVDKHSEIQGGIRPDTEVEPGSVVNGRMTMGKPAVILRKPLNPESRIK